MPVGMPPMPPIAPMGMGMGMPPGMMMGGMGQTNAYMMPPRVSRPLFSERWQFNDILEQMPIF